MTKRNIDKVEQTDCQSEFTKCDIDNEGELLAVPREPQSSQILALIDQWLQQTNTTAGTPTESFFLVLCYGSPGTGKTATVNHCLSTLNGLFDRVFVNCAFYTTATSIKRYISQSDDKIEKGKKGNSCKQPRRVLVLDEADFLGEGDLSALMEEFRHDLIIALANTLPTLKATIQVQAVAFGPFSPEQIAAILAAKTHGLQIDRAALELLARKAASLGGDLRKAFALLQATLHTDENNEHSNTNQINTIIGGRRIALRDALQACNSLLVSRQYEDMMDTTNIHHQVIVYCLGQQKHPIEDKDEGLDPASKHASLSALYGQYCNVLEGGDCQEDASYYGSTCYKRSTVKPLRESEFLDVCRVLAGMGLIQLSTQPYSNAAFSPAVLKGNTTKSADQDTSKSPLTKKQKTAISKSPASPIPRARGRPRSTTVDNGSPLLLRAVVQSEWETRGFLVSDNLERQKQSIRSK